MIFLPFLNVNDVYINIAFPVELDAGIFTFKMFFFNLLCYKLLQA